MAVGIAYKKPDTFMLHLLDFYVCVTANPKQNAFKNSITGLS